MQVQFFVLLVLCCLAICSGQGGAPTSGATAKPVVSTSRPIPPTPSPTKVHPDSVGGIAFFFCAIPFIWWFILLYNNYHRQEAATLRLNVLSMRIAFSLPLYSLLLYIALLLPPVFQGVMAGVTFFEGAFMHTFFAMLVMNLDGPGMAVKLADTQNSPFCCERCFSVFFSCLFCGSEKENFYKVTSWSVWHSWWSRTATIILAIICFYVSYSTEDVRGMIAYAFFSALALACLCYATLALMNFYADVYSMCKNVNGVFKFLFLIITTFLLTVLLFAQTFVGMYGNWVCVSYDRNSGLGCDNEIYATQRAFCLLMLVIFDVMCVPFFFPFYFLMGAPRGSYNSYPEERLEFCDYLGRILNIFDTLGTVTYAPALDMGEGPVVAPSNKTNKMSAQEEQLSYQPPTPIV